MKNIYYLVLLLVYFFFACSPIKKIDKKTVVLSAYNSKRSYKKWISKKNRKRINIVEGISSKNLDSLMRVADGIILTGGEDINPDFYGHPEYLAVCGKINHQRDTVEKKLFDYALKNNVPLLGICRGLQMTNVALGGTLTPDIPSYIGRKVSHRGSGTTEHVINIQNKEFRLFPENKNTFLVNSNHHQCIDKLAEGLTIIAKSTDGVLEAVSYDRSLHPYIIAVQFHPERMQRSSISKVIKRHFIKAVEGTF